MYNFTTYLILYDIKNSKRLNKVMSLLRGYCFHVQNSVFEGRLRQSQILELKEKLNQIIDVRRDCILIYPLSQLNIYNKITLGTKKYSQSVIF